MGSKQKNITMCSRAYMEIQEVSHWLGMSPGNYIRAVIETHHQSPSFANLLRRARGDGDKTKEQRIKTEGFDGRTERFKGKTDTEVSDAEISESDADY